MVSSCYQTVTIVPLIFPCMAFAIPSFSFKKMEKNDEISEDDLKELTEKVQKLTDKSIEKIDKAVENKTKEILTV